MLTASSVIVLQFDCCGVDKGGYTLYWENNVSDDAAFPQSCCQNRTACPKTAAKAKKTGPKVFKPNVSINCNVQFPEKSVPPPTAMEGHQKFLGEGDLKSQNFTSKV